MTASTTPPRVLPPGIHLLHKPAGPTSFSLVQACIDALKADRPDRRPRVCHGGTLDPFAEGLLLMLVGHAVKLFDHLHAVPKVYHATVRWGVETDNGDPLGAIVSAGDASSLAPLTPARLDETLAAFVGWHEQTPHATSAKRVDGERAYVKVHRGEHVEMKPARVYMHEARWLAHRLAGGDAPESDIAITVRGGYYVRALARDLGRRIGCGAHLRTLRRVSIGPWVDPGKDGAAHVQGRSLLPWAPSRVLTDQELGDLRQDRTIDPIHVQPPDWPMPEGFPDPQPPIRAFHRDRLTFLLTPAFGRLKPITEFPGGI